MTAPGTQTHGGWRVVATTTPRSLSGANGLRFGPDGALYVASAFGSEVGRVDVASGDLSIVSPRGSAIVSPDDLDFDARGALYAAECMNARVTELHEGTYRVVEDGVRGANGITVFEDRIFVGEFIPAGSIYEVFRDDRPRRVLATGVNGPNGLTVGPDRRLYSALPFAGQVVRVPVDGGDVEVVADGLAAPCSCRTGPDGHVYVGLGGSGEVLRLDPASLVTEVVRSGPPGMDNLDLTADGRIFSSSYIDGALYELLEDGGVRQLLPSGLLAPYGLAATTAGVCVADGLGAALMSGGELVRTDKITDPGFPGYVRGLAATRDRSSMLVTTNLGSVTEHPAGDWTAEPLVWAEGLSELAGVAATPAGGVVVAEPGRGRVLHLPSPGRLEEVATGLTRPVGVTVTEDGTVLVSDEDAGTVSLVADGRLEPLVRDLRHPQDLALHAGAVLVVEAGRARLVSVPLAGGQPVVVASDLPVGAGGGEVRETLNGLPEMIPGPIAPFAGLDVDADGLVHVAGDALGVVVTLAPPTHV